MMKRVALLFGILGFLGCSGSDDGTSTFSGEAIPVAPFGIIETPTPTYEWTPVRWATKYRLVVQETNQVSTIQDSKETAIIDQWYTAEEAGCASGDGLCMVKPDTEVFEENTWKVQTCTNEKCGNWSEPLDFDVTAMSTPRLTDNGDGTVTDNHTKLMWTKIADFDGEHVWSEAVSMCEGLLYIGYSDWRLPSLTELRSLCDALRCHSGQPCGYPFVEVHANQSYWTRTTAWDPFFESAAYCMIIDDSTLCVGPKSSYAYVWPVRSGN